MPVRGSRRRLSTFLAAALVGALALSLLARAGARWQQAHTGLHLEVRPVSEPDATPLRVKAPLGLAPLGLVPGLQDSSFVARWQGLWWVSRTGLHRMAVSTDAATRVFVDEQLVLTRKAGARHARTQASVTLEAGYHRFAVEVLGPVRDLKIRRAGGDGAFQDFRAWELLPEVPPSMTLALLRGVDRLPWLAALAWAVAALFAFALLARALQRKPEVAHALARRAPAMLAVLIFFAGAALRLEALLDRYWIDDRPTWAERVLPTLRQLHPEAVQWELQEEPYRGDPTSYLRHARAMRHFYEARFREPFFVAAAKAGLCLVGGRDLGISIASAFFSALTVLAVYFLGAAALSPLVGLIAAGGLAIDQAVISLSVEGWRDDTFAFWVVLTALAALKTYDTGSDLHALFLGVAGAGATLTRITSFSLVLPLLAVLIVFPRRRPFRARVRGVALSAGVFLLLVVPFLISCAVAYGDPFESINGVAGAYYKGSPVPAAPSVAHLLRTRFRPFQLLDTALVGYTVYPFIRKWNFFDWWPPLGPALAGLALAGGALLLLSPRGRLLWVAWAGALFPFVFTWQVLGGDAWRLTLHAYPFYLVAAGVTVYGALRLVTSAEARQSAWHWLRTRNPRSTALLALGLFVGGWVALRGLPYLVVREAIRAGQPTRIAAGARDALFFTRGWYPPVATNNLSLRWSRGRAAQLRIPLRSGTAYRLSLRLDPPGPEPPSPQMVRVALNGTPLALCSLRLDPERIGRCELSVPAAIVKDGANRLELQATYPARKATPANDVDPDWDVGFAFWYLSVIPQASPASRSDPHESGGSHLSS